MDFDQINDLELSPILEASLIFIEAAAPDFFVGGIEEATVQDFVGIDTFHDTFVTNNLIKADFVIETLNSINRSYDLKIDFLNELDQLQYSFTVTTPASPTNAEIISQHTEVLEGNSLAALKRTTKIAFTLTMLPGPPINGNTPGKIHSKAKVVAYFNYKK